MNTIATTPVSMDDAGAALAAELAVGLLPLPDVLKRFDISKDQLKLLLKDQQFKSMVRQFKHEWHAASNAKDRIKLKAAMMVEENLLELHRLFLDIELNPTARLDAFKQMTVLADVQPKKDAPDSGPRFMLTLNLAGEGSDQSLTIDADTIIDEQEGGE